jgi:RNA polymerase sigma factor (sigma-70 family)
LDEKSFRALLRKFDEDESQAAEKFELMRSRLTRFFESRRCNLALELTDETILRVSRRIAEGETVPEQLLSGYFYGVARNVLKEYLISPDRTAFSLESLEPKYHPLHNFLEANRLQSERSFLEQMLDCLEACVKELPTKDQEIILIYYQGEASTKIENRKKIASDFGLNLNNLRIRVFRIRARLEKCVESCRRNIPEA